MSARKKILYLRETSANFGGIESQIATLADAAARGEFEPALLTSAPDTVLAERFRSKGRAVYVLPMGRGGWLGAARSLERLLDPASVAVVESHMFRESFYGRAIKRSHPAITHVHRAHTYIDCSWIPDWRKRAYHWADRATAGGVDAFIANGRGLRDELVGRAGIAPEKVFVVLNGAPAAGAPDAPVAEAGGRLRPEVAMVANLLEHKGHDILIEALALLKARGRVVRARLIGSTSSDAAFADRVKALARARGVLEQLEFAGFTSDIGAALRGVPVLVLPSDSEGLPVCVLEAMSLGKLVVASSVGAVPECVEDGRTGFLHPPRDPRALAAILDRLFGEPAASWSPVSGAAHAAWRERFTETRMIAEFGRVYRERFGLEVYRPA